MAACMATTLSLTPCASLALCRPKTFPISGDHWQQHSVSFPITVTPLRIERERRRERVFGSFNPASFVTDGEVESAVEDGAGRAEELFSEDDQVELQSNGDVEKINPKFERMQDLPGRGVIVTAPATASSEYDFVLRFFYPKTGVLEDPATGSAHYTLGPHWASKLGKTELNAYHASQRGGKFIVRVD